MTFLIGITLKYSHLSTPAPTPTHPARKVSVRVGAPSPPEDRHSGSVKGTHSIGRQAKDSGTQVNYIKALIVLRIYYTVYSVEL